MKKLFKILLVVICLCTAINLFGINNSEVRANTKSEIKSEGTPGFIFVRVQEGNKIFIYVYTDDGGIFVTKIEEL